MKVGWLRELCIQCIQLSGASEKNEGQQWCERIWELWQWNVQENSGSVGVELFEIFGGCNKESCSNQVFWVNDGSGNSGVLWLNVSVITRIPSGIWSRLYGWLLWMCVPRIGSSQHMVKSLTLNPYMSLYNLKLCTHIWPTNINFRPPLYLSLIHISEPTRPY